MLIEIIRSLLVFAHLIVFSIAIVLVITTDYSIVKYGVELPTFHVRIRCVLTLFALLWITGLIMLFIDTGFHAETIISNSKLLIKIVCVFVMTFNGMLLHMVGLKLLAHEDSMSRKQAIILCIIGAISTTNWFLAGFIGSNNMLAQVPFTILLLQYAVINALSCVCGFLVSNSVRTRLNWFRAHVALGKLGIQPLLHPEPSIFSPSIKQYFARFSYINGNADHRP